MRKVEIFTAQIQEKSFPGWLRGRGFRLLMGDYLEHWQGPEPAGERVVHACTVHTDPGLGGHAMTLWFLLPEGTPEPLGPERLQQAAAYVFERIGRKAHEPKDGLLNVVLIPEAPLSSN